MDLTTALGLIVRPMLTAAGAALATHGYLGADPDTQSQFIGAAMFLLGIGWSWAREWGMVLIARVHAEKAGLVEPKSSPPPGALN